MRVVAEVVAGHGIPRTIELDVSSLEEARRLASSQGYAVLSCRAAHVAWPARLFGASVASGRLPAREVLLLVEQLRDLLVAGLSVIEALDALRRGARGATAQAIERLERALRTGQTLSTALSQEVSFPALLVALVRASELTSDLAPTLTRFLEHERRVAEVRHRLVAAMIYPALLIGVGLLVLLFLFFYVMPRFARIFEGMTGELPWSARWMVGWAQLLSTHATLWLSVAGLLGLTLALVATSARLRSAALAAFLAWRPLQARLSTYFLARWYRATGMLVAGGIPLPQALPLAGAVLPLALQAPGRTVERGVRDGLSPSAAYVRAGMATPVAEQLLLAGERTGDLGDVLTRLANFHEIEVDRMLERTMRAIEPIAMTLIGLCVGLVVVLMYLPIFELASAIQ